MADRVILFIDYQNVYKGARSCFHSQLHPPHTAGQISPFALGHHIVRNSPYDRELTQVRVYRGRPDSTKDPKGYAACTRQVASWERSDQVVTTLRTLRYPYGWPERCTPGEKPQEKGIDVALAVDFVRLAIEKEYDVGILMSTDTDLKPALEVVASLRSSGGPRVEVAAWSGDNMHNRRLSISGMNLWCHWLNAESYNQVKDPTNYALN
ncbi:NYN domain-containing protein [Microbispora sp. NPDC046973]|uniref:NYN domain-containing protein n=1 Tax=Microbispora sp. NPDC046973 TaxID=3155022 RepID=UPI0033E8E40F